MPGGRDRAQLPDDPALLARILAEDEAAHPLYRATPYWRHHAGRFVAELRDLGLKDLRRRQYLGWRRGFRPSILPAFGAVDLAPGIAVRADLLGWRGARLAGGLLSGLFGATLGRVFAPSNPSGQSVRSYAPYFHGLVAERFRAAGLDLAACPASDVGAPEDLVMIDGRPWTLAHLNYCDMFGRAYPHLGLPEDPTYVEIGPGLGRGMEVAGKLFPGATVLGFDIAPQLYVSHQYLRSVFGERFLTYDEAVRLDPADAGEARRMLGGRVAVLPAERLKSWVALPADVLWNSASFQEMEPENVRNYLALVRRMAPRAIYINALPGGNYRPEVASGQVSTAEPVGEAIYVDALAPDYEVAAVYPTDYFLADGWAYRSSVFRRQGAAPG